MKISIIVPVYNGEKYLRPCLDSLVEQTVADYEIILINDGSTDRTQAIIDDYAAAYPGLIRAAAVENGGQGRARNIALRMARGDYLGFVDSDDWVHPQMFEKLYEAAETAGAEMALCDAEERWPDGKKVHMPLTRYRDDMAISTAVWNKLIKRSAAEGIAFAEGLWYEDLAYTVRLMLRVKGVAAVPEALYYYRCGHSSTMNNHNAVKNLDLLKIMEQVKAPLLQAGRRDGFQELLINHVLLDGINRLAAQNSPDKRAVIAALRAYVKDHIPELRRCEEFKRETRKRKIIMSLNYHGLEGLSRKILRIKEAMG